jgi:type IV secretion system protein VirB10
VNQPNQVQEKAPKPPGLLPKNVQSWLLISLALLMVLIMWLTGGKKTQPVAKAIPPSPMVQAPLEVNDAKIAELQNRIQELQREQLLAENALAQPNHLISPTTSDLAQPQQSGAGGTGSADRPEDVIRAERKKREYLSLFSSNVALSYRKPLAGATAPAAEPNFALQNSPPSAPDTAQTAQLLKEIQPNSIPLTPTSISAAGKKDSAETSDDRKEEGRTPAAAAAGAANAAVGKTYVLFEGNILETVLLNRLDGQFSGPVECLLSTDVYSNDRQHLLIPAGSKLLGETKRVDSLGQKRLAVAFHRLLMPDGFSVSLDQFKGLNQIGDTGLRDQVNNHYLRIFGVSLAIGVLGAVAEAGTGNAVTASAPTACVRDLREAWPSRPRRFWTSSSTFCLRSRSARAIASKSICRAISLCPITTTTKCLPTCEGKRGKSLMKKRILIVLLVMGVCVGSASAQFGGVVYDPTNYHNALLRYFQLQQQLLQLKASYTQLVAQYNFAVRMAKNLQNMPARYRAQFSPWRNTLAPNTYGNTAGWVSGVNSGQAGIVSSGYRQATTQLLPYNPDQLSGMNADELARVKSQYASVELLDGASLTALATIGSIRGSSQTIQTQVGNLEQDSLSGDANLNTEVSVLNKINAAGVLTLRTLQDSNKLLASLLEQQTILAKQQRESTANTINADIQRRASLAGNMARATGTITDSLQNFRMP